MTAQMAISEALPNEKSASLIGFSISFLSIRLPSSLRFSHLDTLSHNLEIALTMTRLVEHRLQMPKSEERP